MTKTVRVSSHSIPPVSTTHNLLDMRWNAEDAEKIRELLVGVQKRLPALSLAFRHNDVDGFSKAYGDVELDLIRALSKAEMLLLQLKD